jgi:hypothetical protein
MIDFVKKNPYSITIILLLLWLVYLPVVWLSYGANDDYFLLYHSRLHDLEPLKLWLGAGRPVTAILAHYAFQLIHTVSQLHFLRIITITGVTLLGILLYFIIYHHYRWDKKVSIILTLILCVIPSIQVTVAWAQYFAIPLGLICAASSALVMSKAVESELSKRAKIARIAFSAILLVLALLIQQAAGMYYWVVVALEFLDHSRSSRYTIKSVVSYLAVWLVDILIAYIFIKIGNVAAPGYAYRTALVHNIPEKIVWFFKEPLFRSLSILLTNKSLPLALCVAVIAGIGLWLHFTKSQSQNKVLRMSVLLMLVPLCYLPNLVIAENWPSYRTQFALASLVVIYFISGINNIIEQVFPNPDLMNLFKTGFLGTLAVVGLFSANYHIVVDFSWPQSVEWSYLKSQILDNDLNKIEEIDIIRAHWLDSLSTAVLDEFGFPTTYPNSAPEPMLRLMLMEMGVDKPIKVNVYPPGKEVEQTPAQLVIDMGKLRLLRYR